VIHATAIVIVMLKDTLIYMESVLVKIVSAKKKK